MKTKVFFLFTLIFYLVCSCKSTYLSYEKKRDIETKIKIAIESCGTRSRENSKQFEQMLRDDDNVNEFSNELIENLLESEYTEIDFNKAFHIEIEKVLMRELFHKKADVFLGETMHTVFEINGVKYFMNYLCKNNKNYPNLYTNVYVYDSEKKKIRVFNKVNYNLEYDTLTDGENSYRVFY
ncbi:MAG: hypothetical protein J6Y36_03180 [Treponema sp.]|nr:hypothetical protein [Treponema sp.]